MRLLDRKYYIPLFDKDIIILTFYLLKLPSKPRVICLPSSLPILVKIDLVILFKCPPKTGSEFDFFDDFCDFSVFGGIF